MSGLQQHRWRNARIEGLLPTQRAKAPAVTGLQARKFYLWDGCGQVVSHRLGEG